ncbi:MAG: oligosaccharide flippase family protein [Chloroflexota bacterium]|nr:oligosaccharide flippase family protein [Chloroflexota bacterium]
MRKAAQRAKSLLFEPGDTLSQRVVRGGFWVFALRIASRGLALIRTIVLARVLAPSDFGLMGIALLAMSALETFSQTGFQAAFMQKSEHR